MSDKKIVNGAVSRRTFFKSVSIGIGSALAIVLGYPLIASIVSKSKAVAAKVFSNLGPINSIRNSFFPAEQPTKLNFSNTVQDAFISKINPEQVWVVKKSPENIKVYSPVCPHLGCRYNWDEARKQFVCPCHKSVYGIDGKVVSGPAPRGLDELPTEIKNQNLYVKYEEFQVGIPQKIVID
jgi:menaquinol-cytochrome c reductase iron-sulfur subunit